MTNEIRKLCLVTSALVLVVIGDRLEIWGAALCRLSERLWTTAGWEDS